jgi:EAL domain-containing protein (putative c-di-GMP-specific phosphodiesterase class I)
MNWANLLAEFERGEGLRTVFQPIYELGAEGIASLYGYEALTRGPERTALESPQELFRYARSRGREAELDLACAHAAFRASRELPASTRLFVNLQMRSLARDGDFPARLLHAAQRSGVDAKNLVVELVERQVVRPSQELIGALEELRAAGALIAVDDFGVGLTTLELVIAFSPDFIKLDGAILQGVAADRRRRVVVQAVVDMAVKLDARVVAEGLESTADVLMASRLGVALGQGRCLGREGPALTETALRPLR